MTYLFIFIIILLLFLLRKYKIKWRTFFKKGFKIDSSQYGVYCYCGKQGSGKTYSVVEYLNEFCKNKEIYSNIKTLRGVDFIYFNGFNELLKLKDKENIVIVYDEIFTALTKTSKINSEVLSFLSQMRKRKIILLTTAQEWLEINMTLRRYCRFQIECRIRNLHIINILIKTFNDAENMKWSDIDNEYVAPLIAKSISKPLLKIANSYNTFEQIETSK